jgi:putative transposase
MANAPENAGNLARIMNNIHKFIGLWIRKNIKEAEKAKRIMYNYWDSCITYEASYFTRLNYIWKNPVKHGYVKVLEDWKFGSYISRMEDRKEELEKIKNSFPCDKVNVRDDF